MDLVDSLEGAACGSCARDTAQPADWPLTSWALLSRSGNGQLRRLALGILHPFLGDHPQRVKRGVLITIAGELRHMMF